MQEHRSAFAFFLVALAGCAQVLGIDERTVQGPRDGSTMPDVGPLPGPDGPNGDGGTVDDVTLDGTQSPDASLDTSVDGSPMDDDVAPLPPPCDAAPAVVLAADQNNPTHLVIDEAGVYWVNDSLMGTVVSVPLDGGPAKVLADRQQGPNSIAVDASEVYWTETKTGSVKSISKAGGQPMALYTGASNAGLVYDTSVGNQLVWIEQHAIRNCFVSNCSTNSAIIVDGTFDASIDKLIFAGGNLWWSGADASGTPKISNCLALSFTGVCTPADVITLPNQAYLADFVIDDTNVYWFSGTTMYIEPWAFFGAPAALGKLLPAAQRLALDKTHLYWTSVDRTIKRVPVTGGNIENVACAVDGYALAVDDTNVYFSAPSKGTISRVPKPP